VMLRGQLVADADPATVTPEELGAAMTGADGGTHAGEASDGKPPDHMAPHGMRTDGPGAGGSGSRTEEPS
jgi:general nucleoside transport system ATP-binding protein